MARKKRGGRAPGEWRLTSPEAIRELRSSNRISRAQLAGMLGVSPTSVQNWETHAGVASPASQQKLADIAKQGVAALAPIARASGRGALAHASTSATVGTIVSAYLKARAKQARAKPLGPEELTALIRAVGLALS